MSTNVNVMLTNIIMHTRVSFIISFLKNTLVIVKQFKFEFYCLEFHLEQNNKWNSISSRPMNSQF